MNAPAGNELVSLANREELLLLYHGGAVTGTRRNSAHPQIALRCSLSFC